MTLMQILMAVLREKVEDVSEPVSNIAAWNALRAVSLGAPMSTPISDDHVMEDHEFGGPV